MINKNKTEIILLLALLVLVIPFLLLSFYCHPSADDFILSKLALKMDSFDYVSYMFNNWSGRYFGNFLTTINPLVFNNLFIYKLVPIILLILLFLALFSLIKESLRRYINLQQSLIITSIIYVIYLDVLPDMAEGIYWYSSSTYYFTGGIFLLFLITFFLKIPNLNNFFKKFISIIICIILLVFIVGSNEIHTFLVFEFIILFIIAKLFFKKKLKLTEIVILLVLIGVSIIAISAPGNFRRLGFLHNHFNFNYTFLNSFKSTSFLIGHHIQNIPFIVVSILTIPIISEFLHRENSLKIKFKINPIFTILISILIITSLYFPVYFALGSDPPWRIHNSISLVFIFLWFLNIIIIIKYLNDKKITIHPTPKYLTTILIIVAFLFVFIDFHIKDPREGIKFKGNIAHAYYDLFFKASDYNKEINKRYLLIQKAKEENQNLLEVEKIKNIPLTIFYRDLSEDPEHRINVGFANYYGIKSIKVKKDKDIKQ